MSNADWISGRDFKDSSVELERSDVAEMLDGVSGGMGRRGGAVDLLSFDGAVCSSSACDEDDQKDRDGCVDVERCEIDGAAESMILLLDDDASCVVAVSSRWPPRRTLLWMVRSIILLIGNQK